MRGKTKKSKTALHSKHDHDHNENCGHDHVAVRDVKTKHKPNEEAVLAILGKSKQPLSAYDILSRLAKKRGAPVAPPTIYRALQHLEKEGVVSRIESKNAYILCTHPHEQHNCLFFICRKCGKATEASDRAITPLLRDEAEELGFAVSKQILEILGECESCSRA